MHQVLESAFTYIILRNFQLLRHKNENRQGGMVEGLEVHQTGFVSHLFHLVAI